MAYATGSSLVSSPWLTEFLALSQTAQHSVFISSPYIKEATVLRFLAATQRARTTQELHVRVLTALSPMDYVRGASDIEAVRLLLGNGIEVRAFANLHAKVYLFDGTVAVVSSANMTGAGTSAEDAKTNLEFGIRTDLKQIVEPLSAYLNDAWGDAYVINESILMDVEQVITANAKLIEKMKALASEVGQALKVKQPNRAPTTRKRKAKVDLIQDAERHYEIGHEAKARQIAKSLIDSPTFKWRSLRVIVQTFWNENNYRAAFREYRNRDGSNNRSLVFDDPVIHYDFGQRYHELGEFKSARREYAKANFSSDNSVDHLRAGNRFRSTRKAKLTAYMALCQALRLAQIDKRPNQKRIEEIQRKLKLLSINQDPELVLVVMSRVGPTLAKRIADERKSKRGEFKSLEDLKNRVRGIGPKILEINEDRLQPLDTEKLFAISES